MIENNVPIRNKTVLFRMKGAVLFDAKKDCRSSPKEYGY